MTYSPPRERKSFIDVDNASLCSEMSDDDDSEMLSITRPVNVTIEESYFLNSDGQLLEGIFCKYCGIEFERRDKLWEEHIQSHGGLICDVFIPDKNEPCHKVFESITDFARHCRKDHSRVRSAAAPVKCKKCCYAAQTIEKLKQHRKKHQTRRPAMCELCGRSFFDMNNLRDHIALVHEDKDKLNFYCDICNQGFKLKSHLRYHKNAVHEEKRVTCEVCGRIYSYQNFKRHAAKHVEAKLKCPECGKLFATPGDVKVHVNRSHGERKFACQRCPWTFQTNMALKRHEIVVHENLRPYKCDVCGATMKSKGHLNQHKKKHELGLLPKNATFRPVSRRLKSPPAVV